MKKVISTCLAMCCFSIGMAQDLSIETLWANASAYEKNKQAQTAIDIAQIDLKSEKGKRLPLIYGEGNIQRNLIAPVTPVPAIAFNPNAQPGEILPLKFATNWSSKAGLVLNLDLFNPATKTAIKVAEIDRQLKGLDAVQTQVDYKREATLAYAKVVLASKQYDQAVVDTLNYSQLIGVLKKRYEAGRTLELEYNKAQQEFINKQTQLAEAYRVLLVANAELAVYIDVNKYSKLSSSISDIISKLNDNSPQTALTQIGLNKQKVEIQLKDLKLEALPKLTLNSYYGSQFFSNQFAVWDNNYWNGNAYVNVGIRVPISEFVDRKIKRSRFLLQQQDLQSKFIEQTKLDSVSRQQNLANFNYAKNALNHAERIEKIANRNVEIMQAKYQEGKILLTELNTELSNYFKIQQEVWQSNFDYLQSVLNQQL